MLPTRRSGAGRPALTRRCRAGATALSADLRAISAPVPCRSAGPGPLPAPHLESATASRSSVTVPAAGSGGCARGRDVTGGDAATLPGVRAVDLAWGSAGLAGRLLGVPGTGPGG